MPNVDAMKALGWGDPGSAGSTQEAAYKRNHLTTFTRYGISLLVRKEAVPLFERLMDELYDEGIRFTAKADDWGFANRDERNHPGVRSYHSWGLAIDLNSSDNPSVTSGPHHTTMPANSEQLAVALGLEWGGNWHDPYDPMHFEVHGSVADVNKRVSNLGDDVTEEQLEAAIIKVLTTAKIVPIPGEAKPDHAGDKATIVQALTQDWGHGLRDETVDRQDLAVDKK